MEDIELHRDELFQKLQYVKKQRDDFLEKGKLVEEERNEFVRSNKTLEQYLAEWKRKTIEFKKTNQALKDRVSEVISFQFKKPYNGMQQYVINIVESDVNRTHKRFLFRQLDIVSQKSWAQIRRKVRYFKPVVTLFNMGFFGNAHETWGTFLSLS